jgi:hypothetical protein
VGLRANGLNQFFLDRGQLHQGLARAGFGLLSSRRRLAESQCIIEFARIKVIHRE